MPRCADCASPLTHIHRTLLERFAYKAIFRCRVCNKDKFIARRYTFRLGKECRCPRCGAYRVARLKRPDRVDPLDTDLLSLWLRLRGGGKLFHCNTCRIQFYDRRPLASERGSAAQPDAPAREAVARPDAARWDA